MKQKGNMYEFAKPWNPLGGECRHKCGYCSSLSFLRYPAFVEKYSGRPKLIEKELKNLGSGETIFVVAQNDLFEENIINGIIRDILSHCNKYPSNKYFFQTKNPERLCKFIDLLPEDSIICTTIETNRWYPEYMGNTPTPQERAKWMSRINGFEKHITIEPIMDFDLEKMVNLIKRCNPSQINIGNDSKNHHLPEPSKEKALQLIAKLEKITVVHQKSNLKRILKNG